VSRILPIAGLDMAFANTGIAYGEFNLDTGKIAVKDICLVSTEADKATKKVVRKSSDDLRRARESFRGTADFLKLYPQIKMLAAEVPSGAQSARASWALGIAVGVLGSLSHGYSVVEVSPRETKEATGDKLADKEDVIAWAVGLYPDLPWKKVKGRVTKAGNEHMADAIAIVHAATKTEQFKQAVAMLSLLGP
jgi:hypothetical protein